VPPRVLNPHSEISDSMTAGLLAVLLTSKAIALAGRDVPLTWWTPIAYLWHDAAVTLAFAAIESVVLAKLRLDPWRGSASGASRARTKSDWFVVRRRLVWIVYAGLAVYAVANVPVTRVLATPMTWPMWRAARGPLADSIWSYATVQTLSLCALAAAVAILAPRILSRVNRIAVIGLCVAMCALGPAAAARVDTRGLDRNGWTALIATSLLRAADASSGGWKRIGFEGTADDTLAGFHGSAAGRHVVLIALESTAAQYLGAYGAVPDVMPNLSTLTRHAIVFDHAYAVYPESIKGLYSVLCSAYPPLDGSEEWFTSTPCLSMAGVLARQGYRTALFHSGRFGYLGMDAVVRNRGYEVLADAGDIGGQHQSSFGVDEPSTVARILGWIDSLRPGSRFFVTYLPVAGHHPYDAPAGGPFDDRDELGRYRNALHHGDASLGALVRGIEARGLANETLWIIFGDHGEAFGQHDGNYGHTFHLFEENVHVPLVIAAPGLIPHQTRSRQVVSLIDVAPTLLAFLGGAIPREYEGHSMLDATARMAFFYTDYSRPLRGLRDGRFKMIAELDSSRSRLFDLDADPGELSDIAEKHPDRMAWYAQYLGIRPNKRHPTAEDAEDPRKNPAHHP
jgi:hypothetical protein